MLQRLTPAAGCWRLSWLQVLGAWLVGAAVLIAACQPSLGEAAAGRGASPAGAPAARAPLPTTLPQATGTPAATGRPPVARPAGEPRPAEALPEWVGPLWGRFLEEHFYSAALDREMPYYLYLPPSASVQEQRVPVLYMLHGAAGDNAEWATIKLIDWTDRLIVDGEIPPMIVVLPQGDFGYWVNHVDDGPRWGDYLVVDLVTHLDTAYPTQPNLRARAVGGLSQGGHGALQLTFNHPDVFGVAGAHSPSLRPDDGFLPFLGTGAEYARRDPISLAETLPLATLLRPRLWLDVGADDPWRPRVELLHQILLERGVPHEWHEGVGGHDGDYWQPNVPTYLRWYGQALRAGL